MGLFGKNAGRIHIVADLINIYSVDQADSGIEFDEKRTIQYPYEFG